MPVLVTCDELQEGMRLAEAFVFRGRVMLPNGKVLGGMDIDILQRKYPEVMLKIGDPVLDSLVAFEDDSRDRDVATKVTQQISKTMSEVQEKFGNHTNVGNIDFVQIRNTVGSIIEYLKNNPVSAAMIARSDGGNYLSEHSGNVFYLAMVLGSAVKDYVVKERQRQTAASGLSIGLAMDLLPLGLGAMFMDIGMNALEHLFKPGYELTAADRKKIFEHPAAGADLLPDSMPPATRMIVRWHHENYDGSGYPDKKAGTSLHVFVRIARICDAFDAATSSKLYAKAKTATRALWEMTYGPYRKFYDPVLMKVFASVIQPFPIGARMTLMDGRSGVVVKHNRKSPFCPTMVIAFDEHGVRLPVDRLIGPINVGEGNELRLKSYAGEDLSYLGDVVEEQAAAVEGCEFKDVVAACYP